MLLRFPRRARIPVAVVVAAVWVAVTASPVSADQIRGQEWWLEALHVTAAWGMSKGAGITVALLDTGAAPAAPDLRGRVTPGPDFTRSGRSAGPYWGAHGTAMASLIAGHGHGPGGGDGVIGVAPQARILSIRVVLDGGEPRRTDPAVVARQPAAIAAGIRYAVAHGAQVVDLPLDPGPAAAGGSAAERAAAAYALAKGVVLVAPAGDDGRGADAVSYPAAYPGVISVGAFDRNIVKAPFSSRRPYVTLTAAGDGVVAATPSGGYATVSSTSAASAMVAGIAALIKSRYPALTPAQVTEALTRGTVFRPPGGRSGGSGYGTADAALALLAAAGVKPAAVAHAPQPAHAPATASAQPLVPASGQSLGAAPLDDGIVLFVALLVLLLAMSLFAVIRLPREFPGPPEDDADEAPGSLPQPMSARPAAPPGRLRTVLAGESAADNRAGAPASPAGATGHLGYPGRAAPGQVPGHGVTRPANADGNPPWGPAPNPDSEPPYAIGQLALPSNDWRGQRTAEISPSQGGDARPIWAAGNEPSRGAETGPIQYVQPMRAISPVVVPADGQGPNGGLPIYDSLESDWFHRRGHPPQRGEAAAGPAERLAAMPPWKSAGDEGWCAAEGAAVPSAGGVTSVGLPRRVPQANIVPGSAATRLPAQADPAPSAESTRNRMASFQQGARRARATIKTENPRMDEDGDPDSSEPW